MVDRRIAFRCGARTRQCRKCGHRFTKAEHDLWECPECGEHRACMQPVAREGQRCRYHGGASPGGLAASNFKHGRYSRYLPGRIAERYQEALQDDELLSMRDEVALLDTRLAELVRELEAGDSRDLWDDLHSIYQGMVRARQRGKTRDMARAIIEIGELIERGAGKWATWDAIGELMEQRRKLVESERRRMLDLQQYVTAERVMLLITAIVNVVARYVDDKRTLGRIAADVRELSAGEGRRATGGTGA